MAALSFSKFMNLLDLKWARSFTRPVSQPFLGLDNQGCCTSLSHHQMVGTQGQGLHILQSLRGSAEPWVGGAEPPDDCCPTVGLFPALLRCYLTCHKNSDAGQALLEGSSALVFDALHRL